ncbi:MAG: hypothetical protein JWQ35_357 [Bacteriovoracaceae bacterium]|nr:hypothetical protein [Bacteriovoracaceae bacterium]
MDVRVWRGLLSFLILSIPAFAGETSIQSRSRLPAFSRELCLSTLASVAKISNLPDSPISFNWSRASAKAYEEKHGVAFGTDQAHVNLEAELDALVENLGLQDENPGTLKRDQNRTLRIRIPQLNPDRAIPIGKKEAELLAQRIQGIRLAMKADGHFVAFGVWDADRLLDFSNKLRSQVSYPKDVPLISWEMEHSLMIARGKKVSDGLPLVPVVEESEQDVRSRYNFSVVNARAMMTFPLIPLVVGWASGGPNIGHISISLFLTGVLIKRGFVRQAFWKRGEPSQGFWRQQIGVFDRALTQRLIRTELLRLADDIRETIEFPNSVLFSDTQASGMEKENHHLISILYYRDNSPRFLLFHMHD